jgi:hypothetical protein
MAVRVVEASA